MPLFLIRKNGYIVIDQASKVRVAAFKAFRFGNTEWATGGETSNFWIKIRCLEALSVWALF